MIQKIIHDHPDVLSVIGAHLLAMGITLTDVELRLKITSLCVAIGYGLWRWIHEYRKSKRK